MHIQKHFSGKNKSFEIEKHRLHLSFVFSERCCFHVICFYVTNIHKLNWLIMLLSMPSRFDLYIHTCDDFQKL